MRRYIDVGPNAATLSLVGPAKLTFDEDVMQLQPVRLDTGCAVGLIGSFYRFDRLPDSWSWSHVVGFGGRVTSRYFTAALDLEPGWTIPVDVHLLEADIDWYLGLPVLMRCDILLRDRAEGPLLLADPVELPGAHYDR